MSSKSHDNEVADNLIFQAKARLRREAFRQLADFDIEDDDARMEPLPGVDQPGVDQRCGRRPSRR